MSSGRLSQFIAKRILGIDVNERYSKSPKDLGEQAKATVGPADLYFEDEPTVSEWFRDLVPPRTRVVQYLEDLFPPISWLPRYHGGWLLGDTLAGVTVGLVVVPQSLAYALLAQLPPTCGLYTTFAGTVIYWLFGTSKDLTTAVGSLLVGRVVGHIEAVEPGTYSSEEIAQAISIACSAVILLFGLLRLGWIIEFIPYIPISAFVTSAAITIMSTQFPAILGIKGLSTSGSPFQVIINTCKSLSRTKIDAAIGLASIVILFAIRSFCTSMERRRPQNKRIWSFISSLRLTFVMLLFTLASFLVNRSLPFGQSKFHIIGPIQQGFQDMSIPKTNTKLLKLVIPQIPTVSLILMVGHIATAKAMGALNNYTIDPSQEILALGAANILSPFMGGFVSTASFGSSAVLSKAGVRTPLAGLFSAMVLVLVVHALTSVFYYIPNAALAGLIIHVVYDLMVPLHRVYRYWRLSPVEFLIWVLSVVVAFFKSIEASIYTGTVLSLLLFLSRIARTNGTFLGRVKVHRVVNKENQGSSISGADRSSLTEHHSVRQVFLPWTQKNAYNPDINIDSPYPGVFIYRFSEGYNYINQARHVDTLVKHLMEATRRTSEEDIERESDRQWNDPGPCRKKTGGDDELPFLRAIVLDFSTVNTIDITSIQGLVDTRNSLDRYSSPDTVEWHFANVHSRWTRRALAVSGFGYPISQNAEALGCWQPAFSIAAQSDERKEPFEEGKFQVADIEASAQQMISSGVTTLSSGQTEGLLPDHGASPTLETRSHRSIAEPVQRMATVSSVDRPFFHFDLVDAVDAAVRDARHKDAKYQKLAS